MPADRPQMRPFDGLAPWATAVETSRALAVPLERTRDLPLVDALDRVLAADVIARVDVPSADRAAMDGYAVRAGDAAAGGRLERRGRIAAGQSADLDLAPGTCIEIATGAPIPTGADAVVPVESTDRQDSWVSLRDPVATGQHIARRGEDLERGRAIGGRGQRLHPALLAACAAGGADTVKVWSRPRVLVAPTGDEVVPLGGPIEVGQVFDSNAAGLVALLSQAGACAEHAGIVIDRVEELLEVMRRPGFDLIVTVGGTSVGRRDLVSDAMRQAGEVHLHGVAVRPGKPLLLGAVDRIPVFGLPGFPTTCMMLGYALLDPAVRRMGHRPDSRGVTGAVLAEEVKSPAGKAHLMPVALRDGAAHPTFRFSSAVSSMAGADGWIEIAADVERLSAGTRVQVSLL